MHDGLAHLATSARMRAERGGWQRVGRTCRRLLGAGLLCAGILAGSLPASDSVAAATLRRPDAPADLLARIRQRGELVVGVKRDVPLWGWRDAQTGVIRGLEPDLAADLAARLGVRLRLAGLLTAERIAAVETRRVDVLIATLSDTPERRALLTLVAPHYYASGANLLVRKDSGVRSWEDLRNRRVCGRQGAFYNRAVTVAFGLDVVALFGNALALEALRDGRCVALLHDDTSLIAMLQDPAWNAQFAMPLPSRLPAPWSVAVARTEAGGPLASAVEAAIIDWHRTGFIVALEQRWGIPPTPYVAALHAAWSRRTATGWYCGVRITPATPPDCL